ncbi:MAG: glycosyltransferase, partial [Pseudomonadota bacterium]
LADSFLNEADKRKHGFVTAKKSDWDDADADGVPDYKDKICVISNGMEIKKSHWAAKDIPIESVQLIAVARGEAYKRVDFLAQIAKNAPDHWRITVVTDEKGRRRLTQSELWHQVVRKFVILMNISNGDVLREMAKSHVLIHPSLYEGFCLPAAEAIANQIPVCFVKGSAVDEVVGPFGAGLSPSDGPDKWVDAIGQTVERQTSPDFRRDFEHAISNHITWKNAASQLKSLYNSLID